MGFTSVCSDKMSLILTIPRFIVKLPLVLLRRVCLQWPPTNLCSELIFNVRDQVWRNDLTWNDSSSSTVMKTNKLHHQCNIFAPHLPLRKMKLDGRTLGSLSVSALLHLQQGIDTSIIFYGVRFYQLTEKMSAQNSDLNLKSEIDGGITKPTCLFTRGNIAF